MLDSEESKVITNMHAVVISMKKAPIGLGPFRRFGLVGVGNTGLVGGSVIGVVSFEVSEVQDRSSDFHCCLLIQI